jgi:hypothetical protein
MGSLHAMALANLLLWPVGLVRCVSGSTAYWQTDSLDRSAIFGLFLGQVKPKTSARQAAPTQVESYVNMTLRLHDDGTAEIVRSTQVDGKLIERQGPASEYVYEITKDGRSHSVGFLPQGGFELRGFSDPHSSPKEKRSATNSTTIMLSAPDTSLDALRRGRISLRIYKIKQGMQLETISTNILKRLVIQKTALVQFEVSGAAIARELKSEQPAVPE